MARKELRAAWLVAVGYGLSGVGLAIAQTAPTPAVTPRAGYADPSGLVKPGDPYPERAKTAAPPPAGPGSQQGQTLPSPRPLPLLE